jgi:hypothetical protein
MLGLIVLKEEKSQSQVNDEDSISQGLDDLRFEDDDDEGTVFKVWKNNAKCS